MPDRKKLQHLGTHSGVGAESFATGSDEAGRLRKVIQDVPPQYRIVLVLRDMEGLSDEEVAQITGLRSGTVRVRLHRARLIVRKELMKGAKPRRGTAGARARGTLPVQPSIGPPSLARCKAMYAQLSNYIDDKLGESLRKKLERHLKGCRSCQAFLASLKRTVEQCRRSPKEVLDRKRATRLSKKVLADYERMVAKRVR